MRDAVSMSDIRRLQMLRDLHRLGTITAVARNLSYSTSAVSQQLTQLERDFGAPLLAPDGRRVRLTPQGEVLVAHAEAVLREWEHAHSAVAASFEGVSGSLAITAFETACLALIPPLVRTLEHEHPQAKVTVVQADADHARERVIARETDLAIVERYPGQVFSQSDEIVETVLFNDPMLLAVPETLEREVHGPRDVADLPWVIELPGTPTREWALDTCRAAGFEPNVGFESGDVLLHHSLVREGVAVGFLPALTPPDLVRGVRLIELGAAQSRTVYTVSRASQAEMPLLRAVLEILARPHDTTAAS